MLVNALMNLICKGLLFKKKSVWLWFHMNCIRPLICLGVERHVNQWCELVCHCPDGKTCWMPLILHSAVDSKLNKQRLISLKRQEKMPLEVLYVDVRGVIWIILIQYLTKCWAGVSSTAYMSSFWVKTSNASAGFWSQTGCEPVS